MLTLRRLGGQLPTSMPSSRILPLVGGSKPATMRSVVVFPQPLGPSSEKNSPALDLERDVVDRGDIVEPLRQRLELDMSSTHLQSSHMPAMPVSASVPPLVRSPRVIHR